MICTSVSRVTDGRCHRALGVVATLVLVSPIRPPVALAIVAGLSRKEEEEMGCWSMFFPPPCLPFLYKAEGWGILGMSLPYKLSRPPVGTVACEMLFTIGTVVGLQKP